MIAENPPRFPPSNPDLLEVRNSNRVKDECFISPNWVGEIEGGFEQSSSWVSLFEIAEKLEVRNSKIDVHYGAFIMVGIE